MIPSHAPGKTAQSLLWALACSALLLTRAQAAPVLPEQLDPARVLSLAPVLEGPAHLSTTAIGSQATTVDWQVGEVWRVELRDGTQRFLAEGADEHEAEGQLLLPRKSLWVEVPPTGDVRVVVESVSLRPLGQVRLALGREELQQQAAGDGDRQLVDAAHSQAAQLADRDGFTKAATVGNPVIFRDLRMVPISLQPVILHQGQAQAVTSLRLRLEYGGDSAAPASALDWCAVPPVGGNERRGGARSWSGNMESVYAGMVPNHGQFYDAVDESVFPIYLITGSPSYLGGGNPGMDEFIKWKREKGFDVRVVPFDQIPGGGASISFGALRDWMRTQWQNLRPEYLLLVGDVDGTAACPDSVVQAHTGDYDVSDHFYALQEGDDYFPELFVGRFSVDNAQQLYVMAEKHVIHEKAPNLSGSLDWLTKGLVVSCNYSDTGTPPISPNQTSRWVIDKLRANGFTITSQDSIFYPPTTDGGSQINSAINQGRGIVSYRGWANSNGWIYPAYDRDDVEALTNYMRMPVMGSFVCQTGAFGQGAGDVVVEDPCFGEKITRLGNPGLPRGCVAFVGPSDLHTRTQYNNPVCSGFFNAIFDLGMTSIGPALNNGKMELYTGYPLERDDRFSSYFYFHIYNVLGDANLKIWRSVPTALTLQAPSALLPGQGVLELDVVDEDGQPKDGVLVTLTGGLDGSLLLGRGLTVGGHLLLDLDPAQLTPGLLLTLTTEHVDHLPAQLTLGVGNATEALELVGLDVADEDEDGQNRAGEVLDVRLRLRNAGSAAVPAGSAVLRDPALWEVLPDWFTIQDGSVATPALAAGAEGLSDAFRIQLDNEAPDAGLLHLVADVTAGGYSGVVDGRLRVSSLALAMVEATWRSGADQLRIDQADTLDLVLRNIGAYDLSGAELMLSSDDARVVITGAEAGLGTLAMDDTATVSFALEGGVGLFPGQPLSVRLQSTDGQRQATLDLPLPIGDLQPQDPMGPDAHGYFAIESGDYDVQGHPLYDWVELDPAYGGSGATRLMLGDDGVTTVDLPFPVTHYGRTGSRLSICSNGWVSLGDTWIDDFRNWNLPSSLGPPNIIAAYWDDLKPHYPDSSYVPVYWRHDATEGRVVIAWSRAYNRYAWENPGQPLQELELILFDQATRPTPTGDTEILVQWKQVTDLDQNNNYATCGMENFGHDVGIQVSYANQPSPGCAGFGPGRSVLFTTRTPIHDSSFRVDVQEPRQQQWLNTLSPTLRWDHDTFVSRLAAGGVSYEALVYDLSLSTDEGLLFTATATGASYDLAAQGQSLPEGREVRLELRALVDDTPYPSLQGVVTFYVDATAPELTPALLAGALYPSHLEVGVLANEALASLSAEALGGSGQVLFTLAQDPGLVALPGGQELRYLRAQLQEGVSVLRVTARDEHGLESVEELPLAAVPFTSGSLDLPQATGLVLSWQGGSGWAVALGQRAARDERLHSMGDVRQVEVKVPEGATGMRLGVEAPEGLVLAQLQDGQWRALVQERRGQRLEAELERSGSVGLMPEGSIEAVTPADFRIVGNHPNPFNPETWIRFQLPAEGEVELTVHNLAGARVRRLAAGQLAAGTHELRWDGRNDAGLPAASGVYLLQLNWQGRTEVHRMLMLR